MAIGDFSNGGLMGDAKQKLALAMLQNGMNTSPVRHWTEGTARVINALMGGYMAGQDRRDFEDAQKYSLFGTTGGDAASTVPAPTGGAPVAPSPTSAMPPAATNNVVDALKNLGKTNLTNGTAPIPTAEPIPQAEPAPVGMTPQARIDQAFGSTPYDRAIATRTVLGEAADEGKAGMQAVANVIANRARDGGYGGKSMSEVSLARNQFEPWNTAGGRNRMMGYAQASAPYQAAQEAVDNAGVGSQPDITGGAKYFYAPKAQQQLASIDGRPVVPSFAQQPPTAVIGGHNFYGEKGAQPAQSQQQPVPQAAPQSTPAPVQTAQVQPQQGMDDLQKRIDVMKTNPNPYIRQMGARYQQAIDQQRLNQMFTKPTDDMRELDAINADRKSRGEAPMGLLEYQTKLKEAGKPVTNINQQQESEFQKEAGKIVAKRYGDMVDDVPAAKQMVSDIQTLQDLGRQIGTGKEAQIKAALGPYAEALGFKIDNLGETQAYEGIVNRLAPNLRVKGSGAQSDFELKNFLKSLPSLGNTNEGNEIISRVMQGLYNNKIKAGEIGSAVLNGEITRSEADKRIRDLPDPMQEWRDFQKKNPTPSGSLPAGWSVKVR